MYTSSFSLFYYLVVSISYKLLFACCKLYQDRHHHMSIHGVWNTSPSLAIEVNPINASGSVTKRRRVIIRSSSELKEISRLLSNPKVAQLAKNIDEVNPSKESSTTRSGTDIFEI